MKKIISILIACIILIALSACGSSANSHEGEAKTPSASKSQKGKNYQEVVDDFTAKGFTNVKTEKLEDLVTGWLTKDGEVEFVSVDGNKDYKADTWHRNGVEVVITYHTFPIKQESYNSPTDGTSSETTTPPTTEPPVESESEILTVENNEELATLLKSSDYEIISAFAKKYKGRTIEFDANIAYMAPYKNYKTRYDILINTGDYSETTQVGPSFKFEDVNVTHDLYLTGDNIPEHIKAGLNIRVTAKVVEFNENTGVFFLKPVSTKMR